MSKIGYEGSIKDFLEEDKERIFGEIDINYDFQATKKQQKDAWLLQIDILKDQLASFDEGTILFEYEIPRMGSIIDNVLLMDGLVFIIEFKVGENSYEPHIPQINRYVKILKNYHYESRDKIIVPILVATEAEDYQNIIRRNDDIFDIIKANKNNLSEIITLIINEYKTEQDLSIWSTSKYTPTPSILESARRIYETHEVPDINTYSSDELFLNETEQTIDDIIDSSKESNKKSIIFVTGVPGAGKTLIGLNTATKRTINNDENAVFLSGNDPLVEVLWEALARDSSERNNISTDDAKIKVKSFIQKLYQFKKHAANDDRVQHEQIVIFDEAQRAWTQDKTERFMRRQNIEKYMGMSEPEFLISIMDRREDWAVIICLVGQGQEINTGESGIIEWFDSLEKSFSHWDIYASKKYLNSIGEDIQIIDKIIDEEFLNLYTTIRSLDAPNLPNFIEYLLKNDKTNAEKKLKEIEVEYPLYITRNLSDAKKWINQEIAKYEDEDSIRTGLLAQSKALRLRPEGIFVKAIRGGSSYYNQYSGVTNWFLNKPTDVRSSNYLELPATEFDIQGLEIDYSIVCWDANLRYINGKFEFYEFKGTEWTNVRQQIRKDYLLNSYRVLLTRARRGMVIFVPKGNDEDETRKTEFYDGTYEYLKSIGIEELK